MNTRAKIISSVIGLGLVTGTIIGSWYMQQRWRNGSESLISRGGQQNFYGDGRGVEIIIADNDYKETRVVLILHGSTIDPERRSLNGKVYTNHDPVGDLKSSGKLVTHYPPDSSISGLWVDDKKRNLKQGLNVVYISDKQTATEVLIPKENQIEFVSDARNLDPLMFIEKWITLRVRG